MSSVSEIQARACEAAFGKPLIVNHYRGLVAEAIVATALEPDWRWCSADYAAWDFDRPDGLRLEVKQSAKRQTWDLEGARLSSCRFDIKSRKGRYEGADWFEEPGRNAHIYVLAHHFVGNDEADHRDPVQWEFFTIPTHRLPGSASIGIDPARKLAMPCSYAGLKAAVDEAAAIALAFRATERRTNV